MGQNSHTAELPQTQNQSNAMLNDPRDGRRLTDNPKNDGQTPAEKVRRMTSRTRQPSKSSAKKAWA